MAFIFPEDKADFTAPNGVTYSWDGDKWVVKAFKADENDFVTKVDFEKDQERQDDEFAADQAAQDELIADNKRSIDELMVTKGPVARYECKGLDFFLASRNGELYVNSGTAADVTLISLAAFDLNGNPSGPVADGDIIEFVEAAAARNAGELSRFRITKGDDPKRWRWFISTGITASWSGTSKRSTSTRRTRRRPARNTSTRFTS